MADCDYSSQQCPTGQLFCCDSIQKASSAQALKIIDTLGSTQKATSPQGSKVTNTVDPNQKASSPQGSKIRDTLPDDIPSDADVGLTCYPITALDIEQKKWYVCLSIASEAS